MVCLGSSNSHTLAFSPARPRRRYRNGIDSCDSSTKESWNGKRKYEADFLVDTGATGSLAPATELQAIGVKPVGKTIYELANGILQEYPFGLVEISFMGEITAGRVIFGPDNAEPILGVTALESVGITIDPASRTLKRLPAIPLK